MAPQRHRMKRPGAARTEKAFKINVPSAIVRSVASCCACSAGCVAMIAWLAVSDCAHAARKREVGARQREVAWSSAILWIGQACHSRAMAFPQKSQPRYAPGGALFDDLYDYVAAPARPGRRRAN